MKQTFNINARISLGQVNQLNREFNYFMCRIPFRASALVYRDGVVLTCHGSRHEGLLLMYHCADIVERCLRPPLPAVPPVKSPEREPLFSRQAFQAVVFCMMLLSFAASVKTRFSLNLPMLNIFQRFCLTSSRHKSTSQTRKAAPAC